MDIENKNRVSVEDMRACYAERFPYAPNNQRIGRFAKQIGFRLTKQMVLKSASNLNGNLNCSKELEHYAS